MTPKAKTALTFLALAIILPVAGLWGIWSLFESYISPEWTRAIAIFAIVLLPVVIWASYHVGLTESKGKLRGIDQGVERVMRTAAEAIDLRATSARVMRQAAQPEPPPVVVLPEPVFTVRQLMHGEVEM